MTDAGLHQATSEQTAGSIAKTNPEPSNIRQPTDDSQQLVKTLNLVENFAAMTPAPDPTGHQAIKRRRRSTPADILHATGFTSPPLVVGPLPNSKTLTESVAAEAEPQTNMSSRRYSTGTLIATGFLSSCPDFSSPLEQPKLTDSVATQAKPLATAKIANDAPSAAANEKDSPYESKRKTTISLYQKIIRARLLPISIFCNYII